MSGTLAGTVGRLSLSLSPCGLRDSLHDLSSRIAGLHTGQHRDPRVSVPREPDKGSKASYELVLLLMEQCIKLATHTYIHTHTHTHTHTHSMWLRTGEG